MRKLHNKRETLHGEALDLGTGKERDDFLERFRGRNADSINIQENNNKTINSTSMN